MKEENFFEKIRQVDAFQCGPKNKCPDGERHIYDKWENTEDGGTAVCSRCGHRAIDNAFWL
ncbi:MAG: hypothetical protein QNJ16_19155 [Rhodobacter sp.]|nr:hypothetical protein [Rhodobacter sp.]